MSGWSIELLGGLRAIRNDTTIDHFRTQRAALLLASLALNPGAEQTREVLGEMLWPEEDPQQQRTRLRYELTMLRRALGDDALETTGTRTVRLAAGMRSDVHRFETVAAAALRARNVEDRLTPLREAFQLYRGELLPGWYLPEGCPPEQDWISLTRDRLKDSLAEVVRRLLNDLETLGHWEEAEQVRRQAQTHLPDQEFPATASRPSASAPQSTGDFVGRERERNHIREWLQSNSIGSGRLLTLTGPGGIGKTRLVREVTQGQYLVFLPLSDIDQAGRLYELFHQQFALPRRVGLSVQDQVTTTLRSHGNCLVVLDNVEHLLPQISADIEQLMEQCPQVRFLATSRRLLQISGEQELIIQSLSVEDSVSLFLRRARIVRPEFARSPQSQAAVRSIVNLLEGSPLALELAATRSTLLNPTQMLEQLKNRLRFLVRVRPGDSERHQSIRAALEWSFDLLTPAARAVLPQLGIFRGGFTLSAAVSVCGENSPVLDALEELHLHSLLQLQPVTLSADSIEESVEEEMEPEARYTLLEIVREFSVERLVPSDRQAAQERHALYFVAQSKSMDASARAWRWENLRLRFLPDLENFRAATAYAISGNDNDLIWQILDATVVMFFELGYWEEISSLLEHTESIARTEPERLLRYLGMCGAMARRRGAESEARSFWDRRLTLCRTLYAESKSLASKQGERLLCADRYADVLLDLAGQAIDLWDTDHARVMLDECRPIMAENPLPSREVVVLVLTARLYVMTGENITEALALLKRAEEALVPLANDGMFLYIALQAIPIYRQARERTAVERLLRRGLHMAFSNGHAFIIARFATELGKYAESNQESRLALIAYSVAYQIHRDLGSRLYDASRADWQLLSEREKALAPENAPMVAMIQGESWEALTHRIRSEFLYREVALV